MAEVQPIEMPDAQPPGEIPAAWRAALTIARAVSPNSTITLPAATLLAIDQLLEASPVGTVPRLGTVADLALRYTVSESTARGWLHAGRVPGAVCLPRLGWRFDFSSLAALDRDLATPSGVSLGGWRKVHGNAA